MLGSVRKSQNVRTLGLKFFPPYTFRLSDRSTGLSGGLSKRYLIFWDRYIGILFCSFKSLAFSSDIFFFFNSPRASNFRESLIRPVDMRNVNKLCSQIVQIPTPLRKYFCLSRFSRNSDPSHFPCTYQCTICTIATYLVGTYSSINSSHIYVYVHTYDLTLVWYEFLVFPVPTYLMYTYIYLHKFFPYPRYLYVVGMPRSTIPQLSSVQKQVPQMLRNKFYNISNLEQL